MKLHFLKTKWSDIILLQDNNHFALVDTGFDEQFGEITDYLEKLGVKSLDFILLTHFHRDHYGSLPQLLDYIPTGTVYYREYSGLDCTTAWGSPADDDYRQSEMEKWENLKNKISQKSTLVMAESISEIAFTSHTLKLYNNINSIRKIYDDKSYPETCGKICFSENQNSLSVFFEADGKTIFLGGDMQEFPSPHPLADYAVLNTARKIGKEIDFFKAPHHGTVDTASAEALSIFRPKTVVITNEDAYLSEHSDIYDNLRRANDNVRILLTENETVVIDTRE